MSARAFTPPMSTVRPPQATPTGPSTRISSEDDGSAEEGPTTSPAESLPDMPNLSRSRPWPPMLGTSGNFRREKGGPRACLLSPRG